mmetsp:Transcript_10912/g.21219  ORF Transcript_10912/g.21219 Transcript_10912/m.21219 type:complete len:220 (+) Transcript_10912:1656-2315(+)
MRDADHDAKQKVASRQLARQAVPAPVSGDECWRVEQRDEDEEDARDGHVADGRLSKGAADQVVDGDARGRRLARYHHGGVGGGVARRRVAAVPDRRWRQGRRAVVLVPSRVKVARALEAAVGLTIGRVTFLQVASNVNHPVSWVLELGPLEAEGREVAFDVLNAARVDLPAALAEQQQVGEELEDCESGLVDDADDGDARAAEHRQAAREGDGGGAVEP